VGRSTKVSETLSDGATPAPGAFVRKARHAGLHLELTRLRNATETLHRKIERDLDLLRPSFTLDQYVALLQRFYGFHQPWESEVDALLDIELPGFFESRKKLEKIESDLRFLGSEPQDLLHIPLCEKLPPLNSAGSVLGSLYVIEGSSLGGRILTRHFSGQLGIAPDAGCRFFSGYGERTGQMWSAFGELMSGRPSAEDEEMLAASVSTFELLGQWLESEAHE